MMKRGRPAFAFVSIKVALIYAIVAGAWIVFSDKVLGRLWSDPDQLERMQTFKGLLFVLISALFLAGLVRFYMHRVLSANTRLAQSETRFRTVFENAPVAYQSLDREGRLTDLNPSWTRLFGWGRDEVMGKHFQEFLAESDRQRFRECFEAVLRMGRSDECEVTGRTKEGALIHLSMSGRATFDPDGTFNCCHCVLADISERIRREQETERMNRMYSLLSQVNQAVARFGSREEVFDHVCRAAFTYGGFKLAWIGWLNPAGGVERVAHCGAAGEAIEPFPIIAWDQPEGSGPTGMAIRERRTVVSNHLTSEAFAPWRELLTRYGIRSAAAFPIRLGDEVTGALVLYADEPGFFRDREIMLLEEVASDVSFALNALENDLVRRRAVESLKESEARYRFLAESITDVVWLLDPDTMRFVYVSPSVKRLRGFTTEEALAMAPGDLTNRESWNAIEKSIEDRRKRLHVSDPRSLSQRHEVMSTNRDGTRVWTEVVTTLVKDEGGHLRVLGVSRDITERKRLEEQFLRAQRMESIGTLASGIAHDLNNILAPITLSIEMLRNGSKSPQDEIMLNMLRQGAERAAGIVSQLLTFGRGVGGQRMDLKLLPLLKELAKIIRETFPKSIVLQQNVPADLWPVRADPTQIHQVLLNLCVNARDAMPEGGNLSISAENLLVGEELAAGEEAQPGPYIVVEIADTGTGIPAPLLDKIFDPFFTTKAPGKGTGLGLSTVVAIVKNHGGFVKVFSRVGEGTRFRIHLPALVAENAGGTSPEATAFPPSGKGECVLLVDDEEAIRELGKRILESSGYEALTAMDGADAIEKLSRNSERIRAVVTDISMPGMDGVALIGAVRERFPDLCIVAMTGLPTIRESLAPFSPAGFLEKPFTAHQMLLALHLGLTRSPHGPS